MSNVDFFNKNGYVVIRNVLEKNILDFITQYALFDEMKNFTTEKSRGRSQVPNAHSKYADPAMETLLLNLQDTVEKNTGKNLYPTYSYYRVYRNGDFLKNHIDRPACEISATVCLNYSYDDSDFSWPIYVDNVPIVLRPGDIAIYKGTEKYHRRDIFDHQVDSWQVQAFLHYVDSSGLYSEWKYDKRSSIGEEFPDTKNPAYISFVGK